MSEERGPGVVCYHCDDCGTRWLDMSRDWRSPSGDDCPLCDRWCHSHRASTEEFDDLHASRTVRLALRMAAKRPEPDRSNMKAANTPGEHNWRVIVYGPRAAKMEEFEWYFEYEEEAKTQAELVSWADPKVEAYVMGIGWVPAAKVGR